MGISNYLKQQSAQDQYLTQNPSPSTQVNTAKDAPSALPGSSYKETGGLLSKQYMPDQTNPYLGSVESNQTVQGQLDNILDKDSDLMKRAYQTGLQEANSRGLLNTNLAGQTAQLAVLDKALPIAEFDASAYLNQSKRNQDASNRFLENRQQTNLQNSQEQLATDLANWSEEKGFGREQLGKDRDVGRDITLKNVDTANEMRLSDQQYLEDRGLSAQDAYEARQLSAQESAQDISNRIIEMNKEYENAVKEMGFEADVEARLTAAQKQAGLQGELIKGMTQIWNNDDLLRDEKDARAQELLNMVAAPYQDIGVSFDYMNDLVDSYSNLFAGVDVAVSGGGGQATFQ